MSIKERIKLYANERNLNTSTIERMCGLSKGSFRNSNSMNSDAVSSFLISNPELSAEWLMRGEGEMIKDNPTVMEIHAEESARSISRDVALLESLTMQAETPIDLEFSFPAASEESTDFRSLFFQQYQKNQQLLLKLGELRGQLQTLKTVCLK